ncbi:MAG TPA: septum formation initiator family protein [Rubrobacter sp.]|nr:septum formation initiator family protein [Rubrobacteraceae bacterium]MDQ3498736.1 septum formation initiator family protein [Actinomycetota bacterium]HEV8045427.1 septum formation initiator family protein [Rubrobacter sp.]
MVVIYAAFLGLLLASYVPPLQDILHNRAEIPTLEQKLQKARTQNIANERLVEELNTPAGIERAARERYGMVRPGEKVYIIPKE